MAAALPKVPRFAPSEQVAALGQISGRNEAKMPHGIELWRDRRGSRPGRPRHPGVPGIALKMNRQLRPCFFPSNPSEESPASRIQDRRVMATLPPCIVTCWKGLAETPDKLKSEGRQIPLGQPQKVQSLQVEGTNQRRRRAERRSYAPPMRPSIPCGPLSLQPASVYRCHQQQHVVVVIMVVVVVTGGALLTCTALVTPWPPPWPPPRPWVTA